MAKNVLLIVAAGKASRFGGFPKAFCNIGTTTNVENTIKQADRFFQNVYLGVNRDTFARFRDQIDHCEMFPITTGQGDAHSLLKCMDYVREKEPGLKRIYTCWGDAFFVDEQPFEQFTGKVEEGGYKAAVACALDQKPYAWFELNDKEEIIKSHFASEEKKPVESGMHDQSLFSFDTGFAEQYLNQYREALGIPYDNDEALAGENEMKLLFSFDFLRERGQDLAKCVSIAPGKVLSFNTQEELEAIKRSVGI